MSAHTHLTKVQVFNLNERYGWFQYGDAQGGVSMAFAQDAIEAYERTRRAGPELLAALEKLVQQVESGYFDHIATDHPNSAVITARAAIAKATGVQP